jgi:hypothetical protein
MFGLGGQAALAGMKVAVVGAGGGGSLITQTLAHLGIGQIVVVDFDRVMATNLSRIVGARPRDARRRRRKVDVMRRLVRSIDPTITLTTHVGDITYTQDARALVDCDFIFSATDTQFARYAVNALCHQYLIPGAQVGAKVLSDGRGDVQLAYAAYRPIDLSGACLECGGAIDPNALRREQLSTVEQHAQNYVDMPVGPDLPDPSVITLNSTAVALALLDFQFAATGMTEPGTHLEQRIYHAPERALRTRQASPRPACRWCNRGLGDAAFGRGDDHVLPLRPGGSELGRTRARSLWSLKRRGRG